MRRRSWCRHGALLAALAALALTACGSSGGPDVRLMVQAAWKDDPGTAAEVGFWVSADVGWPDRGQSCNRLSDQLQVTVNDRAAIRVPYQVGDCVWDAVFTAGPFSADQTGTVMVQVLDGGNQVGQATFPNLFPSYPVALVHPTNAVLHPGDSLVLRLLAPLPSSIDLFEGARYQWLDPPDSVPPFYTFAPDSLAGDRETITVESPTLTGPAVVTIRAFNTRLVAAEACSGFSSCNGQPDENVGPVFLQVAP